MKILSSVVVKEVSDDLIFALSLEYDKDEFLKFEDISAQVLRYANKTKEFTHEDLVAHITKIHPEVPQQQIKNDIQSLCEYLIENRFFS